MSEPNWRSICLKLLDHFEANEGTTYLYLKSDREAFLNTIPNEHRDEVDNMLIDYHD